MVGIIDGVIDEPLGGAQRDPNTAILAVGLTVDEALRELAGMDGSALKAHRRDKFVNLGSARLA